MVNKLHSILLQLVLDKHDSGDTGSSVLTLSLALLNSLVDGIIRESVDDVVPFPLLLPEDDLVDLIAKTVLAKMLFGSSN